MAKKKQPQALPAVVEATPVAVVPAWASQLEGRELQFVLEYVKDLNGMRAALRAFPHLKENSAADLACRYLKKQHVADAVEQAIATVAGANLRTRVLEELVAIALHDPGDYFSVSDEGVVTLKNLDTMTPLQRAAIAGLKSKKRSIPQPDGEPIDESEFELKLSDKQGALTTLLKGLGAFRATEKPEATAQVAVQVIITKDAAKVL